MYFLGRRVDHSALFLAMTQESSTESVLPPPKQFVDEDDLAEIWDARGMKFRVDELHMAMIQRGLNPQIDLPVFRKMFRDIVRQFFVDGEARRPPEHTPRQRFPKVF